jgi:hypothetical protein
MQHLSMQHLLDEVDTRDEGVASCELSLDDPRFSELQEVLFYWEQRCAGRFAPPRSEIEPEPLKHLLNRLMIVEVQSESPRLYRFRLVGSRIYELYGAELTGRTLEEIRPASFARLLQRDYAEAVVRRAPALWLLAAQRREKPFALGCLTLPLSNDGESVDRLLCVGFGDCMDVAPDVFEFDDEGICAFRALVPSGRAPAFARRNAQTLWIGPGHHLVHYPVSAGRLVNLVAFAPAGDDTEESWSATELGAKHAFGNCEGWTGMLAAMKAWVEHGINLRDGFYA